MLNLPRYRIELNKYLITWHKIARKSLYFQDICESDISTNYSLNKHGKMKVENSFYTKDRKFQLSISQAFVQNSPFNPKLKVSFLDKVSGYCFVCSILSQK
ncbi:MAG: lipocalin family protein [Acinetobacter sp.]